MAVYKDNLEALKRRPEKKALMRRTKSVKHFCLFVYCALKFKPFLMFSNVLKQTKRFWKSHAVFFMNSYVCTRMYICICLHMYV